MSTPAGTTQKPLNAIATLTAVEADSDNKLPERLHLLRVGKFPTEKYGNLDIAATDLQEMVDNFNKGLGRSGGGATGLPVNFRHDKGGVAAAWINGLETDGKDLWGTKVDWSKSGEAAITNKEYKCLSSEFTPRCLGGEWVNPENTLQKAKNVFTGAGLTNIPMFTGNRPVMASAQSEDDADSDKQVIYINAKAKEQTSMTVDELRVKEAANLTTEEKVFASEHKAEFSADEQKRLGLVEASAVGDTPAPKTVDASQVDGTEGIVQVDAAQLKTINDQVSALTQESKDRKHAEASADVDKAIARGAIKSDQKDAWVSRIEADASMKSVLADMHGDPALAEEQGGDATGANVSASEELNSKAAKIVADSEGKVTLGDATKQVLASDSDLNERLNAERGVNASTEDDEFKKAGINRG